MKMMCIVGLLVAVAAAWAGAAAGAESRIESTALAFSVADNGRWELVDKRSGEVWRSNPDVPRFARVKARYGTSVVALDVSRDLTAGSNGNEITLDWRPGGERDLGTVQFKARLLPDDEGLRVTWSQTGGAWRLTEARFPDSAFRSTKSEAGYLVVPNRMGLMVPAGENKAETRTYPTYRCYFGLSMAMAGAVKHGSAVLLSWTDPYCSLETRRSQDLSFVDMSLVNVGPTGAVTMQPLGKGGYVEIGKAYREVARDRGLLVTLKEKWPNGFPLAGKEYLSTQGVYHNDSGVGKTLEQTFDTMATTAEHIRRDVGIDQAMFNTWGWGNMGYDRHPDMLPAAAECGGNEGLQDCARRVKALGYMFGLRDNYQDIYQECPSWDPKIVMRNPDGSLMDAGMWAGKLAYRINPKYGLKLAQREQNLPGIKDLFHPDFLYMDTTMATPLFEDFSREHPLTLSGDMYWKKRLCEYARGLFGVFGSEEGVEWGVPCADFFESLMSARTLHYINEVQIPLFEIVYGDCVQIYQGDRTMVNTPTFVLDHILCAEMPMVWTWRYHPEQPWCRVASVTRTGRMSISITYEWKTYAQAPPSSCGRVVEFADPSLKDCWMSTFKDARGFTLATDKWPANSAYTDGPVTVTASELAAPGSGEKCFDIYVYMTTNPDGSGDRVKTRGTDVCVANGYLGGYQRSHVGRLKLSSDGSVSVSYPLLPDLYSYARCDDHRDLAYLNDGLMLNTYRICSPLNRLTANTPMTEHCFLTKDRAVQKSRFGDVTIIVNYGETPYDTGSAVLPHYGFLVESPQLVAFRATFYAGRRFSEPTLAVVTTSDGKPISASQAVQTYRAYGDEVVTVAGRELRLE